MLFNPQRLQYLRVAGLLVRRDLKIKYRGSFLGYLWSMLNPLLFMLVISVVFSFAMKGLPNYHLHVLAGILCWNMTTTTISLGTQSVLNGAMLLRKIRLPIWVLPSVPLGMALTNLVLALGPFAVVALVSGVRPTWQLLWLPVVLGLFALFLAGVATTLAVLNVFFRDVGHVLDPVLSLVFYATPIIFDRSNPAIPKHIADLFLLNPFTHFVELFRAALIANQPIEPERVLLVGGLALVSMTVGTLIYKAAKQRIMFRV
jgi:ABC-type polysaccharide/polyol phosphate export permease